MDTADGKKRLIARAHRTGSPGYLASDAREDSLVSIPAVGKELGKSENCTEA
jgi:hypothetical protein